MKKIFTYIPIAIPLLIIYLYRYTLSYFIGGRRCRFEPTCSAYGLQAYKRHGLVMGTKLTINRIGRCHPWGEHGYDPVPEKPDNSSQTKSSD